MARSTWQGSMPTGHDQAIGARLNCPAFERVETRTTGPWPSRR